ncbi:MAG: peptidase M16 [Phycisphaeraceae bacterium]|nr:MAG: peptidase M16 [Phycisphaeraceae bacterium]
MTRLTFSTLTAAAIAGTASLAAADIPSHPRNINFPEVEFEPPAATDYRTELNGIPVYLAPSSELPLVNISFTFRAGGHLDPSDKVGLSSLTGQLMQTGGTESLSPEQLDEELAFLAADVSVGIGGSIGTANLNTLTDNLDESFALFMDMVRSPGFDEARFEVLKNQTIESMRQRNDDGLQVLLREWDFLLYGVDSPDARRATLASVESITIDDMRAFHARTIQPGNMIIAVAGDFEPREMLGRLSSALEGWDRGSRMAKPAENTHEFEPGVYYIKKEQAQGQVLIGQRGLTRDDPDAVPVQVMNDILGGSGFTSRITNRVRTDEGLAYTAGSVFRNRVDTRGDFISYYFSKVPTVALAGRTVIEEIDRIRDQAVQTDELETVKGNIIETFPRRFESKAGILSTFVTDEWTGRDPDHWNTFRDRVGGVSPEDVQRVAREYLDPDNMAMLIVGPWDDIAVGNTASEPDPNRVVTMGDIKGGQAKEIPMRDPLTLELPEQN